MEPRLETGDQAPVRSHDDEPDVLGVVHELVPSSAGS
jgi:hypothetical protein